MTFRAFADEWRARRGYQLVRPGDNDSRLKLICAFVLPGTKPPITFGEKPVADITAGDIETYRHHRREQKRSAVTINHDLKLLRKMFAWGIRERLLTTTPFKVAGESVIRLDPESPREERLTSEEAERKLFDAASPHLRGVLTAMLETCCRPGEILSPAAPQSMWLATRDPSSLLLTASAERLQCSKAVGDERFLLVRRPAFQLTLARDCGFS